MKNFKEMLIAMFSENSIKNGGNCDIARLTNIILTILFPWGFLLSNTDKAITYWDNTEMIFGVILIVGVKAK